MAKTSKPRPTTETTPTAGDVLLAALWRRGVKHFFANPGTDFPAIVEGFARAKESGAQVPRAVLVPHENLAVAMAHGAYLVTGDPQALMVHVNVGTANTINMLTNAARDRTPLLLLAGRSPIMEAGAFGARSRPIHWAQEMYDQAGMVRELVKWDYELRNPGQAHLVVARALEAATASPPGPVYLTLPREALSGPVHAIPQDEPRSTPSSPHPAPEAIAHLADMLLEAERPLLVTNNSGRGRDEAEALASVAHACALPVVAHVPHYLCLASDHPLHHGFEPAPYLEDADLIVVLECDVPWMPGVKAPPASARVVHIGEDPAFLRYPVRSYRSDLSITATAGAALRALEAALEERSARHKVKLDKRRQWATERANARRAKLQAQASADTPHITPEYASRCVSDMAGANGLIVNEYQLRPDHCARTQPGSYFAISSAGGLGWSIGAALGAKLAAPDRFVVATIGDGGMIFSNPTACHWVAQAHELPILMVVFNNTRYAAVRGATMSMFASGAAGRENGLGLADLSPSPPFEKEAEAYGAYAARVERPADLPKVLAAARAAVEKDKRHALVNIITPY
jgi:acetolactate synthase-1/2/3 large subunit